MLAHPRQSPCNTTSSVCLLDHGKTRHWAASRSVHLTQVVTWSPNKKKEPSSFAHLDKKSFYIFMTAIIMGGPINLKSYAVTTKWCVQAFIKSMHCLQQIGKSGLDSAHFL